MADECVWIAGGLGAAAGIGTFAIMSLTDDIDTTIPEPPALDAGDNIITGVTAIPPETKVMYSAAAALTIGTIWYLICGGGKAVWKAATK